VSSSAGVEAPAQGAARLGPAIAPLRDADRERAVELLARAFRDNPLNLAVIGSGNPERRLRSNRLGTALLLPVAQAHGEVWAAHLGRELLGVLVGTPPGAYPLPPGAWGPRLRCLVGQGWRVARGWARVFEALDALHPPGPHWYLGTLGVDARHRGRGVGAALLRHWVERAEDDAASAYLETDLLENLGFYEREGFRVVREAEVLGVRVWCMQRPPSAG
jgi:ribosomal protein S18 acetylase RimI-like enzyme